MQHNLTEQAVASKIILGEAEKIELDKKLTEVTVNGGGILSQLTNGENFTPGYADILIQYKFGDYGTNYSRVWEVKHRASNEPRITAVSGIACGQIERYITASRKYEQKFNIPLYEGYTIGAFIIPGIDGEYLLIFSENEININTPVTGRGVVYYLECKSVEQAQKAAEALGYTAVLEGEGKYTPVYEPGIIYEVCSIDPAITIGIIVIAGTAFFAVPAIAAGGIGATVTAGVGAAAQMITTTGTYYLYPATAFA